MALTYGGVKLPVPNRTTLDHLDGLISHADIFEFLRPGIPSPQRHRPLPIGTLYWPTGACRWAEGHFLIHSQALELIRLQAYSGGFTNNYGPLTLTMTQRGIISPSTIFQDRYTVSASMYMLPPRPIADLVGIQHPLSGLWLLTLVDDRYFWWERFASITVTGGTTTWSNLLGQIATGLGITLTADTISSSYLKPSALLAADYKYLPPLLDKVCSSIGHRLVRHLDGTIATQTPTTALAVQNLQLTKWPKQGGGLFAFTTEFPNDVFALTPASVRVNFPRVDDGDPTGTHSETVTLSSLALSQYPVGVPGRDEEKLLTSLAVADYVSSAQTNAAELTALTAQMATDFYLWQLARSNVKYAGIVDYTANGMVDHVYWGYRADEQFTCVQRPTWNDFDVPQAHHGAGGSLWEFGDNIWIDGDTVVIVNPTIVGTITWPACPAITRNDFMTECVGGTLYRFVRTETVNFTAGCLTQSLGEFVFESYQGCCNCDTTTVTIPPPIEPKPPCCFSYELPDWIFGLVTEVTGDFADEFALQPISGLQWDTDHWEGSLSGLCPIPVTVDCDSGDPVLTIGDDTFAAEPGYTCCPLAIVFEVDLDSTADCPEGGTFTLTLVADRCEQPAQSTACCEEEIPELLYLIFGTGTGVYSCMGDSTYTMTYNGGSSQWEADDWVDQECPDGSNLLGQPVFFCDTDHFELNQPGAWSYTGGSADTGNGTVNSCAPLDVSGTVSIDFGGGNSGTLAWEVLAP